MQIFEQHSDDMEDHGNALMVQVGQGWISIDNLHSDFDTPEEAAQKIATALDSIGVSVEIGHWPTDGTED